jgi:DNA modification methylase
MQALTSWRDRIVGFTRKAPHELPANDLKWRRHPGSQRAALRAALEGVGTVGPVILNVQTGRLVDGHLRVELAIEAAQETLPVILVELSLEEERLVLATYDPIGALAEADTAELATLLSQVETADDDLRRLLDGISTAPDVLQVVASEDVPALTSEPVSMRGDVWLLGPHRLLCGDSTDVGELAAAMGDRRARVYLTDPPYGNDYKGSGRQQRTIRNNRSEELGPLLRTAFAAADSVLADDAAIYISHPAGPASLVFATAFVDAGWHLHQTLVWVKDAFVLGHSDYHYQHEPILYGWRGKRARWYGGRSRTSVLEAPRPRSSPDHPTMKPIELLQMQISNSSRAGDIVFDGFLGSGSTLLAAHLLGRQCVGIELSEGYVDLAISRWQTLTNQEAVLEGDGRSFAEVAAARR